MTNLVTPPTTSNFRDLSDAISPTYLNGPNGAKYRYPMSTMYDGLSDGAAYSIRAGLAAYAPPDAFQWIGDDRQIIPGFAESTVSYTGRLQQWLDTWAFAGTPTGMLLAILGYCLPAAPKVATVDNNGQWWTYTAGAAPMAAPPAYVPTPPTQTLSHPNNWRWDVSSWTPNYLTLWARVWPIVFSTSGSPWAAPTATYGGGAKYGDGTCYGWAGTRSQAAGLTAAAKIARSTVAIPFVIVNYDAAMFDSTLAFGSSKLPDGNWGRWSKIVSGQYVPARPQCTTCSFVDGTG